ncbi:MAG: hypothetical protein ACLUD2_08330 [Clostridium sp.]
MLFTKGAPDVLLERIERILTKQGIKLMTSEQRSSSGGRMKWAAGGLRVLAVKLTVRWSRCRTAAPELENSGIFLGMAACWIRRDLSRRWRC